MMTSEDYENACDAADNARKQQRENPTEEYRVLREGKFPITSPPLTHAQASRLAESVGGTIQRRTTGPWRAAR